MLTKIYDKAKYCRAFEISVFNQIKKGNIHVPVYLSAGQELISATISCYCESIGVKPLIFAQHRGHSTYLSFGGDVVPLIDELLGLPTGCANGMGGSASIQNLPFMFGHDGLMGSNVPIGVGACYASRKPTIVYAGDASGEEDYALAAYGWAATKDLPILFVIEDNNLSILTEKSVRRSWEIHNVANGMGMSAYRVKDSPLEMTECLSGVFKHPLLLNIDTVRKFWHAGAGSDHDIKDELDNYCIEKELKEIEQIWEQRLGML